jgi:hypothetical protein
VNSSTLIQALITIGVALVSATLGGIGVELLRYRQNKDKERQQNVIETSTSFAEVEKARINDEQLRRKEIDDAAREIREFLKTQVHDLSEAIDKIEEGRASEREKWNQMLGELSTRNLQFEMTHRRDLARIAELEEEFQKIDIECRDLRRRLSTCETNAVILNAKLELYQKERDRLAFKSTDKPEDESGIGGLEGPKQS